MAVKGLKTQLLPNCCYKDLVVVEIEIINGNGARKRVVVASSYLPYGEDNPLPSNRVVDLVEFCQREWLPLILGCNVNAHHKVWGTTDTNGKGEKLLEFLVSTDLKILNRGGEPTFVTVVRKEVLGLTVRSRQLAQKMTD